MAYNFTFDGSWDSTSNFAFGYSITATQQSYVLSGQTAILGKNYQFTGLTNGSFTLSGQAANFLYGRAVVADYGAFVLSGQNAGFLQGKNMLADQASFVLSGQDASFYAGVGIYAVPATFTVAGQDAAWGSTYVLAANQATFSLTGQDMIPLRGYLVTTNAGNFVVTGQDANLLWHHWMFADARTDNGLVGQDVIFTAGYGFQGDYTTYSINGQDAVGGRTRLMLMETGNFVITREPASLVTIESNFIPIAIAVLTGRVPVLVGKDMTVVAVQTVKPIVAVQADS